MCPVCRDFKRFCGDYPLQKASRPKINSPAGHTTKHPEIKTRCGYSCCHAIRQCGFSFSFFFLLSFSAITPRGPCWGNRLRNGVLAGIQLPVFTHMGLLSLSLILLGSNGDGLRSRASH